MVGGGWMRGTGGQRVAVMEDGKHGVWQLGDIYEGEVRK